MPKETLKDLGGFELVLPAKQIFDAFTKSADALTPQEITPERAKQLKLVLGSLNAYINAHKTKIGYFRLTGVPDKVKFVKKYSDKMK